MFNMWFIAYIYITCKALPAGRIKKGPVNGP